MRLKSINKILFITLSNIGDVILTLPVLSALKECFPDVDIDVIVGPRPKDVFKKDKRIKRVFIYDKHSGLKQKIAFIKTLRDEKYDMAVDMRTSLIPFLIGVRYKSGLISLDKSADRHKESVHLNKLKPFGIEYKKQNNIWVDNEDREKIGMLLKERGVEKDDVLIGVSPTCRSLLKQWSTDGFIQVIKGLLEERLYKVVLIGDSSQTTISRKIKDAVAYDGLVDLTGKIDLNELFALVERMQVLLTCDSAAMHIACNLGIKVVALFGPTDVKEYGPTGKDDIVIRRELSCAPCRKAVCKFRHECMKDISAEEVLSAVKELIRIV